MQATLLQSSALLWTDFVSYCLQNLYSSDEQNNDFVRHLVSLFFKPFDETKLYTYSPSKQSRYFLFLWESSGHWRYFVLSVPLSYSLSLSRSASISVSTLSIARNSSSANRSMTLWVEQSLGTLRGSLYPRLSALKLANASRDTREEVRFCTRCGGT